MSPQKARDLFSAAAEGTLDPGLRASFERTLAADPNLAAEYRSFQGLYEGLRRLADEPVEVPLGLADRISARIDHDIWERRRNRPAFAGAWFRSLGLGTAAAVLILGAVASLRSGGEVAVAGVGAPAAASPQPMRLRAENGELTLAAEGVRGDLKVRDGESGAVLDEMRLRGERVERPIRYAGGPAVLIVIERSDDAERVMVAVPGTDAAPAPEGRGTVLDAAKAAAAYYRLPVEVSVRDPEAAVAWRFAEEGADPVGSRFDPTGLALSRAEGLLVLRKF